MTAAAYISFNVFSLLLVGDANSPGGGTNVIRHVQDISIEVDAGGSTIVYDPQRKEHDPHSGDKMSIKEGVEKAVDALVEKVHEDEAKEITDMIIDVIEEEACQDYARYDGLRYTGAENYTCLTYCQTGWCNKASYRTEDTASHYKPGRVITYYSLEQMKKIPFLIPVVDRLGVDDPVGVTPHQAAITGYNWYLWDSQYALKAIKLAGPDAVKGFGLPLELLKLFKTNGTLPEPSRVEACQRVGHVLGVKSWIMNELDVRCEDVPDVVKTAGLADMTKAGRRVSRLWDNVCKKSTARMYKFRCYVSGSYSMLWDANIQANTGKPVPSFNLPWDAACCCCGGGTSRNKPGQKLAFCPSAAKVVPQVTELEMVGGRYVYAFPQVTYPPLVGRPYPFSEGASECEDYQLGRDIEDFAIQFEHAPKEWAGWAGYTCRFYHYQESCSLDGRQSVASLAMFRPIPEYYDGMIRESIARDWLRHPDGVNLKVEMNGLRRADAFKVCCACGGGKKMSMSPPVTIVDVFDDSYYVIP
jgi:hypothetical protein